MVVSDEILKKAVTKDTMIRFKFIRFSIVLFILCFITSCKKDTPKIQNDTITENNKSHKPNNTKGDLVIRDNKSTEEEIQSETNKQESEESDSQDEATNTTEQIESEVNTKIYYDVEILPEFPGGLSSLNKYISDKTKNLNSVSSSVSQLRTMISFIVELDGTTSNASVLKSSGNTDFDEDAKNIVLTMPAWTPAQNGGTNVRMRYIVPVIFNPAQ